MHTEVLAVCNEVQEVDGLVLEENARREVQRAEIEIARAKELVEKQGVFKGSQ